MYIKKILILMLPIIILSCNSIPQENEIDYIGVLQKNNYSLYIRLPYQKPNGITNIPINEFGLQIHKLICDDKRIIPSWSMSSAPEDIMINTDAREKTEYLNIYCTKINDNYSLDPLLGAFDNNLTDYRFPIITQRIIIKYSIYIDSQNTVGPYWASFTLEDDNLEN